LGSLGELIALGDWWKEYGKYLGKMLQGERHLLMPRARNADNAPNHHNDLNDRNAGNAPNHHNALA